MKHAIIPLAIAAFALFTFDIAAAQTGQGRHELSGQISFMIRSVEHSSNSVDALTLSARYGYFISNALEFEPELMFGAYENNDPGFIVSMNLAYNIGGSNQDNKIVPFVLAGGGVANTFIWLPNIPYVSLDDTHELINAGAGIKAFFTNQIALRLEYRYQRFFMSRDVHHHNLYVGMSAFFGD